MSHGCILTPLLSEERTMGKLPISTLGPFFDDLLTPVSDLSFLFLFLSLLWQILDIQSLLVLLRPGLTVPAACFLSFTPHHSSTSKIHSPFSLKLWYAKWLARLEHLSLSLSVSHIWIWTTTIKNPDFLQVIASAGVGLSGMNAGEWRR